MRAGLAFAGALVVAAAAAQGIAPADRKSGFDTMAPSTQAMQRDDSLNPGMLWVRQGAELFARKPDGAAKACADCHATEALRGVALRYPAFSAQQGAPVDLGGFLAGHRAATQAIAVPPPEDSDLLALTTFVASFSRGMRIAAPEDPRLTPFVAEGEALFLRRVGQLNFSCAQCHDANWGRRLAGATIPQGHANGYPLYRLEWQAVGSLQRRLRNCLAGVRAEPFPYGAPEYVALELYLKKRAAGLTVETPAVRP